MMSEPTKKLILHIELPEIWVDDLEENLHIWMMDGQDKTEPTARDMSDMITTELMRDRAGVTLVTMPGEKCMNHEFDVISYTGTIVGAEVVDK